MIYDGGKQLLVKSPNSWKALHGLHNAKFPLKSLFNQQSSFWELFMFVAQNRNTVYLQSNCLFYYIIKSCLRVAQICLAWLHQIHIHVFQTQSGQSLCIWQQPVWLWQIRCQGRLFPSRHTFSPVIYACCSRSSLELARGWLVSSIVGSNRLRVV